MVIAGSLLLTVVYLIFQTQIITAISAVWYILHMKTIKPLLNDLKIDRQICGKTLLLGITSFLSQISLVAAMAAINNMLRKYGAIDEIFGQARYAQIPMAPVGAVAFVLIEVFPNQLISIFGAANESSYYTEFAIKAFRIYLCMIIMACINKACFIFLQAIGKAAASTALSMLREVVFGVGFAILLPIFWGLNGVLFSMPVSDILTFIVAVILISHTYKELNTKGVQIK